MWPAARSSVPEPEGVPAHVIFFQQPSEYFGGQKVRELFVDVVRNIPEAGVYTSEYQEMNALMASQVQSFALGKQTAQQALAKAAAAIRSRTSRA
jgi:ABC-type glycerol-3-phosphate transport system substrate-binding protein